MPKYAPGNAGAAVTKSRKGAYDAVTHPLLVFRFLSDPERKTPVFPPTLHVKFVCGGTETPSVSFTHRKYAFGYFRQRDGQSPSAVRASAKRSDADAIADSSLGEGALG